MSNKKKVIFNALLFFLIFGLTVWGVFHGENLSEILEDLRACDKRWLIPAIFCVVFYIWGESIIIWYLTHSYGIPINKISCFLFSSVGFFFSCVTPSASGGQPMQVYFMRKKRIPIPVSSVILLIVTITYKTVLVLAGLGILIFGRGFYHKYLSEIAPVFYLGIILNVICVVVMVLLVFHPSLVRNAIYKGMNLLQRFHIVKSGKTNLKKLDESMNSYHNTAEFMKKNVGMVVNVFWITVIQRTALFAVPCCIYKAFGLSGTKMLTILLLQTSVSVSVDMLPLPGGMGISETLFLMIFEPVFGEFLLPGMVLSRGLGYYTELLISAIFTLIAVIVFLRTPEKKEKV